MKNRKIREKIIKAVILEFNEKGRNLTMDEIAEKAGVSKKTLYNQFEDKHNLMTCVMNYVFDYNDANEDAILDNDELDILEKIRKSIIKVSEVYRMIDYKKIMNVREKHLELFIGIDMKIEREWDKIFDLIQKGMYQGRIRRIPIAVLRSMIEGSVEQFISTIGFDDEYISYEEAVDNMINVMINGIRMS